MLRKIEQIAVVITLVLLFAGGAALAADDKKPAGLVEKTVMLQKKFNTFDDSKLREIRGMIDLASFDRMVGYIVVDAEYTPGKGIQDYSTYRFDGLTDVRDKKGKKMTMEDLVVPSLVKLNFFPNNRKAPVLYSIKVVKTFTGGDRAWTELEPE